MCVSLLSFAMEVVRRLRPSGAGSAVAAEGRFPMKTVAEVIGVFPLQSDRMHPRATKETDWPAAAARRQTRGRDQGCGATDVSTPSSSAKRWPLA